MVSVDQRGERNVVGRLVIERRADPARRDGEPPIVAEVRGPTRDAVLGELRRIAENDAELSRRLDSWQRSRAGALPPTGEHAAPPTRRLRMPDGAWWTAERRHEMAQLRSGRAPVPERRVFMFFTRADGALRRAEVPPDHPAADVADPDALARLWSHAEALSADSEP